MHYLTGSFDPINGWDPWGLSTCPMAGGCPQSQNGPPFHGSGFGLPESLRGDLPSGPTIDRARKQAAARNPGGYARGIARGLLVDWLTGTPLGWGVQILTTPTDTEGSDFLDALLTDALGDAESLGFDTSTWLNPFLWSKKLKSEGARKLDKRAGSVRAQAAENLRNMGLDDVTLAGKSYNSGRKSLEKAGFRLESTTKTGRKVFSNPETKAIVTYDSGKALGAGQKPHWTIQDKGGQYYDRSGRPVDGPHPPMGGKHIPGK